MRCKDCKYYKPVTGFYNPSKNNKFGECEKIFREEREDCELDNVIVFAVGGDYDAVYVTPNFGCIHFEKID